MFDWIVAKVNESIRSLFIDTLFVSCDALSKYMYAKKFIVSFPKKLSMFP